MSPVLDAVNEHTNPLFALDELLSDSKQKTKIFDELEQIFGRKLRYQLLVSQAAVLAGKKVVLAENFDNHKPQEVKDVADQLITLSAKSLQCGEKDNSMKEKIHKIQIDKIPVTIELQSHSTATPDDHHHGCGAHESDTTKALQLTAITAFVLEAYVQERYPHDAHRIHIVRTHHITGADEMVWDANQGSVGDMLSAAMREKLNGKFSPLFYKDRNRGVVRVGKENHHGIDQELHNEYIVRFSQHHKANGLEHTSVLEQVMLPDIRMAEMLALKLIAIAQHNRIEKDKQQHIHQPIFIHLDEPVQEPKIQALYHQLYSRFISHPSLQELLLQGDLHIVQSETRRLDLYDKNSLHTTFLE